jgi:S1-C subfamily serine protease
VTGVDLVLLGVIAVMAFAGFRRGLVAGVASLGGLVAGAYLGARLAPGLLGDNTRYLPIAAFTGAVVGAALGQTLGVIGGRFLRSLVAVGPLRPLDSVGGLALGGATGVVLCWAVGAVLLYFPGQDALRQTAQESVILSTLNRGFPPERLMETLSRIDPFSVLAGPQANVGPPPRGIARDPDVVAALASVVRVTGTACGLGVGGTGWVARPGLVVTSAHVVAGVSSPRVHRGDGSVLGAAVVSFDRRNDVAVLRVPGLRERALPAAPPARGLPVALLGYPQNGPLRAVPARLGATVETVGRDAYGGFPVERTVTTIRGDVRSGNSGGPLVDARGRVRATAFARRAGSSGGFGVSAEIVAKALDAAGAETLETDCVER